MTAGGDAREHLSIADRSASAHGNFTQIPNALIRNDEISSKSLGVIVHLLSLPPGFRISIEFLCKARKEGKRQCAARSNSLSG